MRMGSEATVTQALGTVSETVLFRKLWIPVRACAGKVGRVAEQGLRVTGR